jgi:hypothetical protein
MRDERLRPHHQPAMAQGGVTDAVILLPLSGGIADTAGPAAGSSRSRMTQTGLWRRWAGGYGLV